MHPAVAAILAVTPIDDGTVIVEFASLDSTGPFAEWGAPELLAARQVDAVLRWAAERSRDMSDTCGCGCGCALQLEADADELTREQRDVIADPGT